MEDQTLDALWAVTRGDPRICIAVLDGPVDLSHPCFRGAKIDVVETLVTGRTDDGMATAHGTHIASLLFGQAGGSVRGVTPHCRGLIVPVFQGTRDGGVRPCSQLDLARGLGLAVANGAQVINLSGGQFDPTGQPEPHLEAALRQCAEHGVLVVAAAGNDGCRCLHVPAATPSVLVVGAMNGQGEPLEFSNWGDAYREHGVLALGENIFGAGAGGSITSFTGTSFATPFVAGLAGLLLSRQLQQRGKIDVSAVRQAILATTTTCDVQPVPDCRRLLAGRLNAVGALNYLDERNNEPMSEPVSPTTPESPNRSSSEPPAKSGGCGCGGGGSSSKPCGCKSASTSQLVFALGQLDYDFGTEANRDAFKQLGIAVPESRAEMVRYLTQFDETAVSPSPAKPATADPYELAAWERAMRQRIRAWGNLFTNLSQAEQLTWVLKQDDTPIYAIYPNGPFAVSVYSRLVEILEDQESHVSEMVSLPGRTVGKARLVNGQEVPLVVPDLRGLYNWSVDALVKAVLPAGTANELSAAESEVRNFLQRIYFEVRNLGLMPQERALNFAATNVFQFKSAYAQAVRESVLNPTLRLDRVDVERSPLCRPGSDCWDVKLTFFEPAKRLESARQVHRFTIDVSQAIPVTVGPVRSWFVN